MMARRAPRYTPKLNPDPAVIDTALAAMDADELRELIREITPWLDEPNHARFVSVIINRAARSSSGWAPTAPMARTVTEIAGFVEAATRVGYADPSDIDNYLRQGSNAFLARSYGTASRILRTLLLPLANAEIDLGQDEMVDEVLGVNIADCAAQYAVAVYMNSTPESRAETVLAAIDEIPGVGHFWEPLRELERVAIEPLSGFEKFLPEWRALVEARAEQGRQRDWESDADRWRREAVQRLEGAEGLARIARSTRSADDLRAWCRFLVNARDWQEALWAYDEAAEIVSEGQHSRGEFLDGAALATGQLGRKDLPARLERAWRAAQNMVRLRRWLGSATARNVLRGRAATALDSCAPQATRQRGLLHVLLGDYDAAAKLLASAPGLGWSSGEHSGHLLFPLFTSLLTGTPFNAESAGDFEALDPLSDYEEPRLPAPEIASLVDLAGVTTPVAGRDRSTMLNAMRKAAEKRIAGVTENKRRRHYGRRMDRPVADAIEELEHVKEATTAGTVARRYCLSAALKSAQIFERVQCAVVPLDDWLVARRLIASGRIALFVADRSITAEPLLKHPGQHRNGTVHVVEDAHFMLALVQSVQAARVLDQRTFPRHR